MRPAFPHYCQFIKPSPLFPYFITFHRASSPLRKKFQSSILHQSQNRPPFLSPFFSSQHESIFQTDSGSNSSSSSHDLPRPKIRPIPAHSGRCRYHQPWAKSRPAASCSACAPTYQWSRPGQVRYA